MTLSDSDDDYIPADMSPTLLRSVQDKIASIKAAAKEKVDRTDIVITPPPRSRRQQVHTSKSSTADISDYEEDDEAVDQLVSSDQEDTRPKKKKRNNATQKQATAAPQPTKKPPKKPASTPKHTPSAHRKSKKQSEVVTVAEHSQDSDREAEEPLSTCLGFLLYDDTFTTRKQPEIVLKIPNTSGSNERRTVPSDVSFEELLEVVHGAIGCNDFKRKPELTYKLSSANAKDKPLNLQCEEDWEGWVEEVEEAAAKKKQGVMSVNILVTEQYIKSLRTKLSQGKGQSTATNKKRKTAESEPLLDMDKTDDDSSSEDPRSSGLLAKEAENLTKLHQNLSTCQMCGPEKFCKIDRNKIHVHLTHGQLRSWAMALASGMHCVTVKTPPKSEDFMRFHPPQAIPPSSESNITPHASYPYP
ncbi:hypothetical protein AAF712_014466 [Marasmius tenuissimus]|uniref:Uncharacterized protein n=1 Tax=Marasmius tenuissimus TaxID=585030 RepID=A0ABR2ZCY0_9AGAR